MGMLLKRVFDSILQIKISNASEIIESFKDTSITKQDKTEYRIENKDTGELSIFHDNTFVINLNKNELSEYLKNLYGNNKVSGEYIPMNDFSEGEIKIYHPSSSVVSTPLKIKKKDLKKIDHNSITITFSTSS